ncbi:hypothetical protein [Muricomes intestini]|jgi:hypothetical protein|uniref:hypothetical protein n=1 Tax=Muricomes intestini TaxID=1796634 RepID=UPI002FE067F0
MEESIERLVLSDGTEIPIEHGAILQEIVTTVENFSALENLADKLQADGALSTVKFASGDTTSGAYEDMRLVDPLFSVERKDGVITVEFGLRESSDLEKRIKSLEETQAIQDRAIAGLGEAISEAEKEGDK